jgi:hypothetical protein
MQLCETLDAEVWEAFPAALDNLLDALELPPGKPSRGHRGARDSGGIATLRDRTAYHLDRNFLVSLLLQGKMRGVDFKAHLTPKQQTRIDALVPTLRENVEKEQARLFTARKRRLH